METSHLKIVKLEASNVLRLSAVEITPQGNMVVVAGANGAGKSSVLSSIEYALGGDPSARMPVRRGEEKARIVVDLGDIVVRRTFTAQGGSTLTITNADGQKQSSPQTLLDKLVGRLSFDPLLFSRTKPKEQAEILRGLVGIDFEAKESEHAKVFNERTVVNRDVKALEVQIIAIQKHEGLPTEEVSASAILEEQAAASKLNAANRAMREKVSALFRQMDSAKQAIEDYEGLIAEARREVERWQKIVGDRTAALDEANKKFPALEAELKSAQEAAEAAKDVDLSGFAQRAAAVEQTNRKVREAKKRGELVKQLKAKTSEADKLTDQLETIESEKRKAAMDAKYPIDGLAFDVAGGVTFNGIPFEQCSSAEQLKVSVAIGLALNPKLKVLLVRDGSLLDAASMKMVALMAQEADAQIWIETCAANAKASVVIEDGHVQQQMGSAAVPETASPAEASSPSPEPKKPKKAKATEKEGSLL